MVLHCDAELNQHDVNVIVAKGIEALGQPVQESGLQKKLEEALGSLDFYRRRVEALQQWQSKMRDPERTIVCDILANGHTLEPAGDRYTTPPQPVQEPPSEWAGTKAILDEYGLQAIDFVADFKAALAQPVQEPVGEVVNATDKAFECKFIKILPIGTKLYTTPPKREWVGLTDGEAGECHSPNYVQTVARIEAKLKEKNT